MTAILLLTNAEAGSSDQTAVEEVVEVLRGSAEVRVRATCSEDELAEVLSESPGHLVVVAGGDGSLHAAVNALDRLDLLGGTTLGLVPLGTGNDFARGVGIPLEPADAARVVLTGRVRAVDLIRPASGPVVVNAVHLGVGAQASSAAKAWKPLLGRVGYLVGALVAGLRPRFLRLRVRVDGQEIVSRRRRVAQVAVGNGRNVGGGTDLVPDADPTDGALDVLVSLAVGPLARLDYFARLRRGRHTERHDVVSVRGGSVEISGDPFWISADGELTGPYTSRSWRLDPGALRMVLP